MRIGPRFTFRLVGQVFFNKPTHQGPRLCPSKGDRSGSRVGGDLLKTSELLELHAALSEASAAVSNNNVIKSSRCSCLDMAPTHRSYVHLHYSGPSRYNRKSRRHEKCKDLRLHHQTPLRNLQIIPVHHVANFSQDSHKIPTRFLQDSHKLLTNTPARIGHSHRTSHKLLSHRK